VRLPAQTELHGRRLADEAVWVTADHPNLPCSVAVIEAARRLLEALENETAGRTMLVVRALSLLEGVRDLSGRAKRTAGTL